MRDRAGHVVDEDGVVAAIRAVFHDVGAHAEAEDADAWRVDGLLASHVHTDMAVEGVDFDRALYPLRCAGHRALALNLTDLYAVDAEPVAFAWSLAIPDAWTLDDVRAFSLGAARLAAAAACPLLGGDLSSTSGPFVCSITCFGRAAGLSLARSGAKPGQGVWLTRPCGASARGLRLVQQARVGDDEGAYARWLQSLSVVDRRAVLAHAEPSPFHHLEQLSDFAVAAIDVSDGLVRDAHRLARTSHVAIDIDDVDAAVDHAAGASVDDALYGGEDGALLFAVPDGLVPTGCVRIGRVLAGQGLSIAGRPVAGVGYDHFRRS